MFLNPPSSKIKRGSWWALDPCASPVRADESFTLAKALQVDTAQTGRELRPGWDAVIANDLPPLHHVQTWTQKAKLLEQQDIAEQIVRRRAHTKRQLQEDWSGDKTYLFKRQANKQVTAAGFLAENSQRAMSSHPEEIHQSLQDHWVKGIFRYYDSREKPSSGNFHNGYRHLLGPKKTVHQLPPITATQLSDKRKWRGGTHGLDGWRYRELRLLPHSIWELLATIFNALEDHPDPIWPTALNWGSIPLLPKEGPPGPLNLRPLTILSVIYRILGRHQGLTPQRLARNLDSQILTWRPSRPRSLRRRLRDQFRC